MYINLLKLLYKHQISMKFAVFVLVKFFHLYVSINAKKIYIAEINVIIEKYFSSIINIINFVKKIITLGINNKKIKGIEKKIYFLIYI